MHDRLRFRFVSDLMRDIELLSGSAFERFGYRILERVYPADWEHRGTNISGAPVGHVVDSVAHGGQLVGQYSSLADYFDGQLSKLHSDIKHATTKHPQVKKLWLLSAREKGPQATTVVQQVIDAQRAIGRELFVLDCRSIAETIVEHLVDDRFIESISDSLPYLERIAAEWAFTHRIPSYPNYVPRLDDETALAKLLQEKHLVRVVGISGLGKSALCSAIAQQTKSSYELVLWIDATALEKLEELSAIDVFRSGDNHNVLTLIKTRACLLILDDVNSTLDASSLLRDASPETRILVTSQFDRPGSYLLPHVNTTTARDILNAGNPDPCPEVIFTKVWQNVGGHPLLLSILGSLSLTESSGWTAVEEAASDPVALEDEACHRICTRILERHATSLQRELEFMAWIDVSRVDCALWKAVCGANSLKALEKRKFLAASGTDIIRVHDLVFQSASVMATRADRLANEFIERIASHIISEMPLDTLTLQRVVRLHHPLFARELRTGNSHPAFRYAYALARPSNATVDLLGDPVQLARDISTKPYCPAMHVDIFSVVECIEALYTATKDSVNKGAAKAELSGRLGAFDLLSSIPALPVNEYRDLRHHQAKALMWTGKYHEARSIFDDLVREDPYFCAGRLQLARCLLMAPGEDKLASASEALKHIEFNLNVARERTVSISDAVVLSTFSLLREQSLKKDAVPTIRAHEQLLVETLRNAVPFNHQLPYTVAAALGADLWYNEPDLFRRIVDALPTAFEQPDNDREKFDLAQLLKFSGKVLAGSDATRAQQFFRESQQLYEQLRFRDVYQRTQYAECLLLLGTPQPAAAELSLVPASDRNAFWYQRYAQALLRLGSASDALTQIDCALDEKGKERYRSAFLHDRWLIRQALGDIAANVDLEAAIDSCAPGRFRTELESELELARGGASHGS